MDNINDVMRKHVQLQMLDKLKISANVNAALPQIKKRTAEEERERENLLKSDLQIELDESKKRIANLLN